MDKVNFNFFGDSWFWTWKKRIDVTKDPETTPYWHSKSMMSLSDDNRRTLSFTSILLKQLGHNVSYYNAASRSFNSTCEDVNKFCEMIEYQDNPEHQTTTIFVIWVSSDMRAPDSAHPEWNLRNKQRFLEIYDNYVLESLVKVNNRASSKKLSKHHFIFVGGQSGLPKELWDTIPNRSPNMHLLSEHIINTLSTVNTEFPTTLNFDRFWLENDFIRIYDKCDHKSEVDVDLMNYMTFSSAPYTDLELLNQETYIKLTNRS